MPDSYLPQNDPNASRSRSAAEPAGDAVLIIPNNAIDLPAYAKAMRVHVPATLSEASLRVTPTLAKDDSLHVTLRFPSGLFYEPLSVRKVWATGTTAGIEIHGYTV